MRFHLFDGRTQLWGNLVSKIKASREDHSPYKTLLIIDYFEATRKQLVSSIFTKGKRKHLLRDRIVLAHVVLRCYKSELEDLDQIVLGKGKTKRLYTSL